MFKDLVTICPTTQYHNPEDHILIKVSVMFTCSFYRKIQEQYFHIGYGCFLSNPHLVFLQGHISSTLVWVRDDGKKIPKKNKLLFHRRRVSVAFPSNINNILSFLMESFQHLYLFHLQK
jgi:hypothetical protein